MADLETIVKWRKDAATWLATKGTDQWNDAGLTEDAFRARVLRSIKAGETWIAEDDDRPLGTIAIDSDADPGLWPEAALRVALVIHRMIIDRSAAGRGVGAFMLDHAEKLATEQGKRWLVLDAWTSNTDLHRYYQAHDFRHVGTVEAHSTPSAALFARLLSGATDRPKIPVNSRTSPAPSI